MADLLIQLKRERDQAVARLRVANGHTEDAFKKLQIALHEIDILRGSLSKTHDRLEQTQRDWAAERIALRQQLDEAQFWAKRLMRESGEGSFTDWLATVKKGE